MKLDYIKITKILLALLIIANLIFIYTQSLIPPEESAKASDTVSDIIAEIIPPDTKPGEFVQKNVRKLAHFFEFGVLGFLMSLYVVLFLPSVKNAVSAAVLGLVSALIDETLQCFSSRGPQIGDVWIDFCGFAVFSTILYTGYGVIRFIKYKCK